MYWIGVLIFLVSLVGLSLFDSSPLLLIDFPSLIVILALTIPILLASGLFSDFLKGFKLMGQKVNYFSKIDIRRILEATKLAVVTLLVSGAIGTIVGTVSLLANLTDPTRLGPSLAMALLTVFYSFVFILMILPIRSKAKSILMTLE